MDKTKPNTRSPREVTPERRSEARRGSISTGVALADTATAIVRAGVKGAAMAAMVALSSFPMTASALGTFPEGGADQDAFTEPGVIDAPDKLDVLHTPDGRWLTYGRFDFGHRPTITWEGTDAEAYDNGGPVVISLLLWELDSWDGEALHVRVQDQWFYLGDYWTGADEQDIFKEQGDIRVYRVGSSEPQNLAASHWNDQKHEFRIVVPRQSIGDSLSLTFRSLTNSPVDDESYAFNAKAYVLLPLAQQNVDSAETALEIAGSLVELQADNLASLTNDQAINLNNIEGAFEGAWTQIGTKSLRNAEAARVKSLAFTFHDTFNNWRLVLPSYEETLWQSMDGEINPQDGDNIMEVLGLVGSIFGMVGAKDPVSTLSAFFNLASQAKLVSESLNSGEEGFSAEPIQYENAAPYALELARNVEAEMRFNNYTYQVGYFDKDADDFRQQARMGLDHLADLMTNVALAQKVFKRTDQVSGDDAVRGEDVTDLSYIRDLGFTAELDWDYPEYVLECNAAPGCIGNDNASIWIRAGSNVDAGGSSSAIELRVANGLENWARVVDIIYHAEDPQNRTITDDGKGDMLTAGEELYMGEQIISADGSHFLAMQEDNNLVLYTAAGQALWASHTYGSGATRLRMQHDGNLVLYTDTGSVVWSPNVYGLGATFMKVQDDGRLVMYADSNPVWANDTGVTRLVAGQEIYRGNRINSPNGNYFLKMQHDGNLALYTAAGQFLWASRTNGSGATTLRMQHDGNLALYTAADQFVWASRTNGSGATRLMMQNDGNLVLYTDTGSPVWATNTNQ